MGGFAAAAQKERFPPPPSIETIRKRGPEFWKLTDLINAYRKSRALPVIPLSPMLTGVAALHARDLFHQKPHEPKRSMHSWSKSERWTGGAYDNGDKQTHPIMWDKAKELYGYPGFSFEVVASGVKGAAHALEVWKKSPRHHEVLINAGPWKDKRWRWGAVGAFVYEGFASAWFGAEPDPT